MSRGVIVAAEIAEASGVEWEAAMLFAAGDRAALRRHLETEAHKDHAEAWRLMFGLDRLAGDETAFEDRALEYAVRFESLPPVWVSPRDALGGNAPAERVAVRSMTPDGLMQVLIRLEKPEPVVLDFGLVKRIDIAGCELLALGLRERLEQRHATTVANVERIVTGIRQSRIAARNGATDSKPAWLFVLVADQLLGKREDFEKDARHFRETYGETLEWQAADPPASDSRDPTFVHAGHDLSLCDAAWFAALEKIKPKATVDFAATRTASLDAAHAFVVGVARRRRRNYRLVRERVAASAARVHRRPAIHAPVRSRRGAGMKPRAGALP